MNKESYGLKSSPKCWNQRFNPFAQGNGLKRSNNFCFYIGNQVWLIVFMDDILIREEVEIQKVIRNLKNRI